MNCVASGDQGLLSETKQLVTVGFELFDDHDVEAMAQRAARRAITKLAAPRTEQTLLSSSKRGGGVLFHEACGHGLD